MLDWLLDFIGNPVIVLLGTCTIIQIVPIKINPWTWIGKTAKKLLIGDSIDKIQKEVSGIKQDILAERVSTKRWQILNFSNSCILGINHTREEWDHCLSDLAWYEDYCEKNNVQNGVMQQSAVYLKNKYQMHLKNNDFLTQN